ncbi:DUF4192 domain-containing protein [Raineyella sp. LH-20]|uniref:DUF4192 domain-containing protein n=1 Tax=Raineyella sp. LH-20 TaxID=3081204 RepID=UPI002953BBE1|nr:DUF4192 domain-containing protein [Raineyella sp. LH-20]WOP17761.1 DUF4192 domain-containing protein [Raineyella sp. LH-20]
MDPHTDPGIDPRIQDPVTDPSGSDLVVLRPHGLQGMLATVPYLLGFHPHDSLVAVLFDDRRVVVTLRLDSEVLCAEPGGVDAFLRHQLDRLAATGLLLVAYTDGPAPDVAEALAGLSLALEAAALSDPAAPEVLEAVHVAGGRYRSVTCSDESCCPPDGFDYADVLSDPAAAEAVVHGLPAWSDREELRATVRPLDRDDGDDGDDETDEGELDGFRRALVRTLTRIRGVAGGAAAEEMDRALTEIEETGADPDPGQLGRLVALAARPEARDVATLRIERGSAGLWSRVWAAAARRSSGLEAAAPLGLVGVAAWARGDGALVCICLEEAEKVLPDHGLVALLRNVVEHGLHPDEWHRMRARSLARFGPLGPASAGDRGRGDGRAVG